MSKKNPRIDALLNRIGIFRTSGGRFNSLGTNAEQRIRSLTKTYPILDWLTAIFHAAKNQDLEFGGYLPEADKQVTLTLNSLAVTASIALSEYSTTTITNKLCTSLNLKPVSLQLLYCSLCHNDETNMGDATSPDEKSVISNTLAPSKYNQAKYRVPPKFHLSRIYSWYCKPPSPRQPAAPIELEKFVQQEYGIGIKELAQCILLLWTISEMRIPLIWPGVFRNIANWTGSPAQVFLDKFSLSLQKYSNPWALAPSTKDIQSGIPSLSISPIVNLGNSVYSVPIPKLLYTHLEDTFYWKCFDYFKNTEGRPDNTFTNWFGKIFEEYCMELLSAIAKKKYFRDLRYLEDLGLPSLDAAEILPDSATFFEFKNRRLYRKHSVQWTSESEDQLKSFGSTIIKQLVSFANALPSRSELWHNKIKKMRFVVITPYHLNINPFIQQAGWFKSEMQSIQTALSLSETPQLLFLNQFDLEEWGKGQKGAGIRLNNFVIEYINSAAYPYLDFMDWLIKEHPGLGCNPAVDANLERLSKELENKYVFV